MSTPLLLLLGAVAAANLVFWVSWWRARLHYPGRKRPTPLEVLIGFGVSFLDALGIGSFAPTTAILKLRGDPPDEQIPGTLNVGLTAPAAIEVLETVDPISIKYSLVMLVGTCALLMLWTLLPKRQVTRAHEVTTLDDYARAFKLPADRIAEGRNSRITTVHCDEEGSIVRLDRQA